LQTSVTISYLLASVIAYVCQWFFAQRAYRLWSEARWTRPPIFILAHCSLISQIIWVAWNARQPKLRESLDEQEVQHIASWMKGFAPVKQGLQLTSGATGLGTRCGVDCEYRAKSQPVTVCDQQATPALLLIPVCITSLIVARLVRMKEFMVSKRLANTVILVTMESMRVSRL